MTNNLEEEVKGVASSLTGREEIELGYLILGVVFGAVLGILGNLWVAFLFELLRNFIPTESWIIISILGLIITTISSLLILWASFKSAIKHIVRNEKTTQNKELRKPRSGRMH